MNEKEHLDTYCQTVVIMYYYYYIAKQLQKEMLGLKEEKQHLKEIIDKADEIKEIIDKADEINVIIRNNQSLYLSSSALEYLLNLEKENSELKNQLKNTEDEEI